MSAHSRKSRAKRRKKRLKLQDNPDLSLDKINRLLDTRPTRRERPDLYECEKCGPLSGSPALCERCLEARRDAGAQWIGAWQYDPGRQHLRQQAKHAWFSLPPQLFLPKPKYRIEWPNDVRNAELRDRSFDTAEDALRTLQSKWTGFSILVLKTRPEGGFWAVPEHHANDPTGPYAPLILPEFPKA